MVGAFGDVVPRAYQRLELREGRVYLLCLRALLGLLSNDLARELLELAQRSRRQLEKLDLALELRLEPRERGCILGVIVADEIGLLVEQVADAASDVAALLARLGANIDEVQHQRAFTSLSVERVQIEVVVQTRGAEHVQAILEAMRAEGYDAERVG